MESSSASFSPLGCGMPAINIGSPHCDMADGLYLQLPRRETWWLPLATCIIQTPNRRRWGGENRRVKRGAYNYTTFCTQPTSALGLLGNPAYGLQLEAHKD
ncbi:hypothetical protein BS47DRAFT_1349460 [Hydnum rufescens UP504]|uniref:Uncharacterized protein n=1 Tax=Hydnum rufescens UP504 TaxID=1448309 RepID=A0A9P6APU5_9AGAM|nr:hypothetical protein BS47DRAFT_1349460 [Hydnum rufescens UP504]